MHVGEAVPIVNANTPLKDALYVISSKKLGITGVVDAQGALIGVFTDGDLRRKIEQGIEVLNRPICEIMSGGSKRILHTNLAAKALQRMEEHTITSLFVFDSEESQKPVGIIHLHDLLKAGII
jgi:arabinose-5-phosphate isomerase